MRLKTHVYGITTTATESHRGAMDIGRRSRQPVREDEEDEENQVLPFFQSVFNEALLSASVSVIAAQSGESLSCGEGCIW